MQIRHHMRHGKKQCDHLFQMGSDIFPFKWAYTDDTNNYLNKRSLVFSPCFQCNGRNEQWDQDIGLQQIHSYNSTPQKWVW